MLRNVLQRIGRPFRTLGAIRAWTAAAVILSVSAIAVSMTRYGLLESAIAAIGSSAVASHHNSNSPGPVTSPIVETVPAPAPDSAQIETRHAYASGRIQTSLFEDAQQAGLSDPLILKLVEIFGWDLDFARDIKPGDMFAVIYEEKYWMGQKIGDGLILAAEFVNKGRLYRAIGYKDKGGVTKYYEIDGITKQKKFLRTPIEFSRVSSKYTDKATRFHPILKIWTAHRGVDYAAPMDTPIRAAADGQVMDIGWDAGYGKKIIIKHDAAYSTLYAHLSRFGDNPSNTRDQTLRIGSPVVQGQIIGHVGKTGLATGPHLHYEFHVRKVHRDPFEFKSVFKGTPIPNDERQAFFAQAQPLIAQLKLIADRHIAVNH